MSEIKTFSDRKSGGTFSQINLDDGNNILISLTQTEITIFKVGFLGIPKGKLWEENILKFIDAGLANGTFTVGDDTSVLQVAVDLAVPCSTKEEVIAKFDGYMSNLN